MFGRHLSGDPDLWRGVRELGTVSTDLRGLPVTCGQLRGLGERNGRHILIRSSDASFGFLNRKPSKNGGKGLLCGRICKPECGVFRSGTGGHD
jgi:hypothetical protein